MSHARLLRAFAFAFVLFVCSGVRAFDIVEKPLGGGQDRLFLRIGESEVFLKGSNVSAATVCNADETVWAWNYHVASDLDTFDLVLEGKDKTVLVVGGVDNYVKAALKKKRIIPDLPYDHFYMNAVSIVGSVVTCDVRGHAQWGRCEGSCKILVAQVEDGVTLEPYAMDARIPAPKAKPGTAKATPGGATRGVTKLSDASLSSATAALVIVKRPFRVNAEKATGQNFLVVGDRRVLLPLHTHTSNNLCNGEKALWTLPYHDEGRPDGFDMVLRSKNGQCIVVQRVWEYEEDELARQGVISPTDVFPLSVTPVSVEGDTITCRIDGKGGQNSKAVGKEYHAQFQARVKEDGQYVDLDPLAVDAEKQKPAAQSPLR